MAKGNELAYSTLSESNAFSENDLIDRIINVKITTKYFTETGETVIGDVFVIRSDYEIVDLDKGKYTIRKCDIKPSIKLQYEQVASGTAVSVNLFLSNFFVMTKDGRTLMSFNQQTYDIAKVEIQMGYLGQFNKLLGLSDEGEVGKLTYKDLFDFDREGAGIQTIVINDVEKVTTEKLPPDYTLCIHGYVGNTISIAESPTEITSYEDVPESAYFDSKDKPIPNLFYKYVTKRFINTNLLTPTTKMPKLGSDGFLSDTDAKFGVKVVCSKKVEDLTLPVIKDNTGKEVEKDLNYMFFGGDANTVDSTIQKIIEYTRKNLVYTRLNSGVILVVLADELTQKNMSSLFADIKEYIDTDTQFQSTFNNKLPCVYNINIDAMATIVCPFFTWLNPFQYLYFETRYALTNTPSFYANFNPSIYKFYTIRCNVSFATTEDINEMQITAVSDISSRLAEGEKEGEKK